MASILSKEENDQVRKRIKDSGKPRDIWELWVANISYCQSFNFLKILYFSISLFHSFLQCWVGLSGDFWLGGTRLGNGTEYYWIGHNSAFDFSDWLSGEPNNQDGIEACLHMWQYHKYKWNDVDCSNSYYFVCEEEICLK